MIESWRVLWDEVVYLFMMSWNYPMSKPFNSRQWSFSICIIIALCIVHRRYMLSMNVVWTAVCGAWKCNFEVTYVNATLVCSWLTWRNWRNHLLGVVGWRLVLCLGSWMDWRKTVWQWMNCRPPEVSWWGRRLPSPPPTAKASKSSGHGRHEKQLLMCIQKNNY